MRSLAYKCCMIKSHNEIRIYSEYLERHVYIASSIDPDHRYGKGFTSPTI